MLLFFYLSQLAKLWFPFCRGENSCSLPFFLSVLHACKNSNGILWHANDSPTPKELNKIILIKKLKKRSKFSYTNSHSLANHTVWLIPPEADIHKSASLHKLCDLLSIISGFLWSAKGQVSSTRNVDGTAVCLSKGYQDSRCWSKTVLTLQINVWRG